MPARFRHKERSMSKFGSLLLLLLVSLPAWPQRAVDAANSYHRVICVVPLIGSGTSDDPKRPMFAPTPSQLGRGKSGILAYYNEISDDGQSAIVVFVAVDRASLQAILTTTAPSVQVFDISNPSPTSTSTAVAAHAASPSAPTTGNTSGAAAVAAATTALTAVRKDFNWNRFALRVK
jgi:hypothetical protein